MTKKKLLADSHAEQLANAHGVLYACVILVSFNGDLLETAISGRAPGDTGEAAAGHFDDLGTRLGQAVREWNRTLGEIVHS